MGVEFVEVTTSAEAELQLAMDDQHSCVFGGQLEERYEVFKLRQHGEANLVPGWPM